MSSFMCYTFGFAFGFVVGAVSLRLYQEYKAFDRVMVGGETDE